jgi:hypothetical protein
MPIRMRHLGWIFGVHHASSRLHRLSENGQDQYEYPGFHITNSSKIRRLFTSLRPEYTFNPPIGQYRLGILARARGAMLY